MNVLVTAASRHGSTTEMACAIAAVIERSGHQVSVITPLQVSSLDRYDAVVVGSAVYMGRWHEDAKDFVDRFETALRERDVWLFASGPVGDPPKPEAESPDGIAIRKRTNAHALRSFNGAIDHDQLSLGEKLVVAAVRAPEGDFRDWPEIEGWAREIARWLDAAPQA